MKKKNALKLFLTGLAVLFFLTGCSGDKNISENKVEEYKETLKQYYQAYGEGNFEKAMSFCNKKFEYEEAGQRYVGEDIVKGAIIKNQHFKHEFEIVNMESTNGGILVTLNNSSYLLKLSGIDSYESEEFFTFKKDKIESMATKINEDDYIYITKMVEADPGILLGLDEEKIIISEFTDNSSAKSAGFKVGSEILSIDGVPVEDYELGVNEAVYRLAGRAETTVKVKVLQDGKEMESELLRIMK